jgi:ABC-2 type transport system ATP-binding protein
VVEVDAVSFQGLTKRYGSVTAVDDVSFALEPGSVTGFLGPNGAGKTSTLRVLLGLAAATRGDALVFGRAYEDLEAPARVVGAVLESGDFHPGRSGRNHLRILATAADCGISGRRIDEVLELVGLTRAADRKVGAYSQGMRQRLGLAAALLGDPKLLVLDEPANGLDPAGIHWLRTFLRGYADDGGTVLLSSHVLSEVALTVDQAVIIDRGRLAASIRMDELAGGSAALEAAFLGLTSAGDL